MNMCNYYTKLGFDPFEVAIPLTFHIKSQNDPEYGKFILKFNKLAKEAHSNIWIVKPGENSNRGCGIEVADTLSEIKGLINANAKSNGNRTSIVQLYIDKPLLISGRKFDVRAYAMLTSTNGLVKGFMYRDCYFRTSSKPFDLTNLDRFIHLTNDAV
jgi:tubulin---tyrosine ligase